MKKLYIFGMSALLATGIVVVSCKKDEKSDAEKGTAAAKELCECLTKATTNAEKRECTEIANKFAEYENNTEFTTAAQKELEKCDALPPQ